MAVMTETVGDQLGAQGAGTAPKTTIGDSIARLSRWLEKNDYRGYDTFDGLNARFVRPLTFETKFLRTVLQQGVRRFPVNLRPVLGVTRGTLHQGHGVSGARLHPSARSDGRSRVGVTKPKFALEWLVENQSPGYNGACWGNHFDYQSRSFYLPKAVPTVVWTSLIGHAFLDGYDHFQEERYLQVASECVRTHRSRSGNISDGEGTCITYVPGEE